MSWRAVTLARDTREFHTAEFFADRGAVRFDRGAEIPLTFDLLVDVHNEAGIKVNETEAQVEILGGFPRVAAYGGTVVAIAKAMNANGIVIVNDHGDRTFIDQGSYGNACVWVTPTLGGQFRCVYVVTNTLWLELFVTADLQLLRTVRHDLAPADQNPALGLIGLDGDGQPIWVHRQAPIELGGQMFWRWTDTGSWVIGQSGGPAPAGVVVFDKAANEAKFLWPTVDGKPASYNLQVEPQIAETDTRTFLAAVSDARGGFFDAGALVPIDFTPPDPGGGDDGHQPPPDDGDGDTPKPPPPFDPATTEVLDAPGDLMAWPVTAQITRVDWTRNGLEIAFTKKDGAGRWPDIPFGKPEDKGSLQYTMGACLAVGGKWYASAVVQQWHGATGNGSAPADFAATWFYDGRWGPMHGHQPAVGELVGLFVVAGGVRGSHPEAPSVRERSNVVFVKMPSNDGGTYTFDDVGGGGSPDPGGDDVDLKPVLDALADLKQTVVSLEARLEVLEGSNHAQTRDQLEDVQNEIRQFRNEAARRIYKGGVAGLKITLSPELPK